MPSLSAFPLPRVGVIAALAILWSPGWGSSAALQAQGQFAGDMVQTKTQGSAPERSHLNVGVGRVRLEQQSTNQGASVLIFDGTTGKTLALLPEKKLAVDASVLGVLSNGWIRIFQPLDANDPCADINKWVQGLSMAVQSSSGQRDTGLHTPRLDCTNVGSDAVNGRPADKWRYVATNDQGKKDQGYVWIDKSLRFITKTQDTDGTLEVQNVVEGPQPDALFQVPADYKQEDLATAIKSGMFGNLGGNGQNVSAGSVAGQIGKSVGASAAQGASQAVQQGVQQKAANAAKKALKGLLP